MAKKKSTAVNISNEIVNINAGFSLILHVRAHSDIKGVAKAANQNKYIIIVVKNTLGKNIAWQIVHTLTH